MAYTVALVEDNAINRNNFMQKIHLLPALRVSFVAVNGHDCMEQLKGLPVSKLPQVIFMDLEMPGMDGVEAIRLCRSLYPQVYYIVLTVFDDEDKIFEAIKAGASGYLLKHESADVLGEAVKNVLEFGGAPMSPGIARKALQMMSRSVLPGKEAKNELPGAISAREIEVLEQMVSGRDAKRIADSLNIAVATVRKHITNIYEKLHVQSKAEVMSMAHKNKWFE